MKILPPTTHPPKTILQRAHQPPTGRYETYRQCLRWEFGFTCAFCLLHESDLTPNGVRGTGLMWIEHFIPQSVDDTKVNDYSNCFYTCRYCNQARSTKPNQDAEGCVLLEPTTVVWAEHFETRDFKLLPKSRNAEYTANIVYRINDPFKVERRANRQIVISACRLKIRDAMHDAADFRTRARQLARSDQPAQREHAAAFLRAALAADRVISDNREALERYRGTPKDHDTTCRCSDAVLKLPSEIDQQLQDIGEHN